MTKKVLFLIISVILMALSFTACSSSGEGERVTVPIGSEPEYLDPQIVSDTDARNIVANCFENLVAYSENGDIVPAACESYDVSSDGLVYTFKLRNDGVWYVTSSAKSIINKYYSETAKSEKEAKKADDFDKKVTADDFVYAFKRALSAETKCPYAYSLMNIKNASKVYSGKSKSSKLGVRAKDDYTLVITLERKDSDFLSALTLPACAPCNEEFFKMTRGHYGLSAEYLIYNGPFYISNWAEKTAITARKNKSYRNIEGAEDTQFVKPSSIYFSFNNEQSTRDKKVKDGTYAAAPLTSSQASDVKISTKTFQSAMTSLIFNLADEALSNSDIRKAIIYSFDASVLYTATGRDRADGVIPTACIVGNKSYRENVGNVLSDLFNTKKAAVLLKSGLKRLNRNNLDLVVLCSEESETAVRSVMQYWQSVFGAVFRVSVEAVDAQTLESRVSSGDYQIALYDVKYSDNTAANAVMRYSSGARNNIVNLASKSYDKLIVKISTSSGEKAKIKAIQAAEKYLIENCIIFPISQAEIYYGIGNGVENIVFTPTGEVAYYRDTLIK